MSAIKFITVGATALMLLGLLIGAASAACPQDCAQAGGYSSPHWACCDFGTLDHPLCAGETLCNDESQSSCCGVTLSGGCYRVVRCFGTDACVVDSCGNTTSNPRCYGSTNNAVCPRQANGCTTRQLYDPRHTICCGGALYDNVNWDCCNGVAFEVARSECCSGSVVPLGQCGAQPSASATPSRPASRSASHVVAPSASATRAPAASSSATPTHAPATCAGACAVNKGYTPAGGWSCCDFGDLDHPLCAGEDLCNADAQSTCCGVTLNNGCYRVVRCYGGDSCTVNSCSDTATCFNPTHTAVCSRPGSNGCTHTQLYDPRYTICCGGALFDNVSSACCNGVAYQVSSQECCAGTVVQKGHCCGGQPCS